MPEGLSPGEVGKEISEHRAHTLGEKEKEGSGDEAKGRDRVLIIIEAVLLAVVAVIAAWSGFAAAKWGTESSLDLAKASAARTEANRAAYQAADLRNFDALTFNAWFTAYVAGNKDAMQVAERRFRPQFLVAFNAWLATDPFTNSHAPPGPTFMPQYAQPELARANLLDARAEHYYSLGEKAPIPPTAMSGPLFTWPACCSWWASAHTSASSGPGRRSSPSAESSSSSASSC
jgi:hypothetical protein